MRNLYLGVATLLVIGAVSFWSSCRVDGLVDSMSAHIDIAESRSLEGDFEGATDNLRAAFGIWMRDEQFRQLFIRHPDAERATEAYCELLGALLSGDSGRAEGCFLRLRAQLEDIREMERITLASVL